MRNKKEIKKEIKNMIMVLCQRIGKVLLLSRSIFNEANN